MRILTADKIMKRLDQMITNAIEGHPIENGFDETKMSALETKLSNYLAINHATKQQLLEEKSKISQLVSDISHQTKTPIANMLLYAQLLEESAVEEKEKDYAKSLVMQAEKLNFLIFSLVKISRLETGILKLNPQQGKVNQLLHMVMCQMLPKAQEKGIAITCEETTVQAQFDLKWTAEALCNIVDNAVKYTPCGGQVTICVITYELFVRIDIADTGIGMLEEEITKIFGRFYRAEAVSEEEGVGIGLYLAREIISGQSGYMKVKSKLKRGSVFSVFLPIES